MSNFLVSIVIKSITPPSRFSMISYCSQSRRLAVGSRTGQLAIHELRSAKEQVTSYWRLQPREEERWDAWYTWGKCLRRILRRIESEIHLITFLRVQGRLIILRPLVIFRKKCVFCGVNSLRQEFAIETVSPEWCETVKRCQCWRKFYLWKLSTTEWFPNYSVFHACTQASVFKRRRAY